MRAQEIKNGHLEITANLMTIEYGKEIAYKKVFKPLIKINNDKIIVVYKYQSVSFACQGDWKEKHFIYSKSKFDYKSMIKEIKAFIESVN